MVIKEPRLSVTRSERVLLCTVISLATGWPVGSLHMHFAVISVPSILRFAREGGSRGTRTGTHLVCLPRVGGSGYCGGGISRFLVLTVV